MEWVNSIEDLVRTLNSRFAAADDPGHDVHHALRVARWGLQIAEDDVAPAELVAAALLHDAVNVPKDDPRRAERARREMHLECAASVHLRR